MNAQRTGESKVKCGQPGPTAFLKGKLTAGYVLDREHLDRGAV
jgi:hypothetical protein